jgi:hypothetical protein
VASNIHGAKYQHQETDLVGNKIPSSILEYLSGHASVVFGNKMYVFGGRLQTIKNSNIVYALNFDSFVWEIVSLIGDTPLPVDGHTMVT